MNSKLKTFNKLLVFNWFLIRRNIIWWSLISFSSISQFIILLVFYILNLDINNYSAFVISIPNILNCVFIISAIYVLFQDAKDNSIDDKLLTSKYSKFQIKLSRFIFVLCGLMSIVITQDLFLIFLGIIQQWKLGLIYFICNTFITPFIMILIIFINVLLAQKTNKILYLFISSLIAFLSFGLSLITRIFIKLYDYKYEGKNNEYSYSRLISKDDEYLIQYLENDVSNNKTTFYNNFIPSEWFNSMYSSLFNDLGAKTTNDQFSLVSIDLIDDNISTDKINNLINIRANDINFFNLSNDIYRQLILDDINKIVNKYDLINNNIALQAIDIINQFNWNNITNENVSLLIKDITGVNPVYNQLFYFLKYHNILKLRIPNISQLISAKYNENVGLLFENLFTSSFVGYNLFNASGPFNVNQIYPNDYSVDLSKPINKFDFQFIKNGLIKFNSNQPLYLDKNDIYKPLDINILKTFDPTIVDQASYFKYIDNISITYNTAKDFLAKLQGKIPDIKNYNLRDNYLNYSNIYRVYSVTNSTNTNVTPVWIGLTVFFNILTGCLFFIKLKKKKENYEKENNNN